MALKRDSEGRLVRRFGISREEVRRSKMISKLRSNIGPLAEKANYKDKTLNWLKQAVRKIGLAVR